MLAADMSVDVAMLTKVIDHRMSDITELASLAIKGNCSPSENTHFLISFKYDFGLN